MEDGSHSGIESLAGFEYAVNLVSLSLSGNRLTDLSALQPANRNGVPVGMRRLENLSLDYLVTGTPPSFVTPSFMALEDLSKLRRLSADGNSARLFNAVAGLKNLGLLSLDGNRLWTLPGQLAIDLDPFSSLGGSLFGTLPTGSYGLLGEYYFMPEVIGGFPDFDALTDRADLVRVDPVVAFPQTLENFAGVAGLEDGFAVRWSGQIFIETTGDVTFYVTSDDGARLYIDNKPLPLIDNGGIHNMTEVSQKVVLAHGWHDLRLEYFEDLGGAGVVLSYQPPGGAKQVVPERVLRPAGLLGNYHAGAGGEGSPEYLDAADPRYARIDPRIHFPFVSSRRFLRDLCAGRLFHRDVGGAGLCPFRRNRPVPDGKRR